MENKTYEQMLIRIDQKLDDMLPRVSRIEATVEKQQEVCLIRSDNYNRMIDDRVSTTAFHWVVGILVTVVFSIAAISVTTRLEVADMKSQMVAIKNKINATYMLNYPSENISFPN